MSSGDYYNMWDADYFSDDDNSSNDEPIYQEDDYHHYYYSPNRDPIGGVYKQSSTPYK